MGFNSTTSDDTNANTITMDVSPICQINDSNNTITGNDYNNNNCRDYSIFDQNNSDNNNHKDIINFSNNDISGHNSANYSCFNCAGTFGDRAQSSKPIVVVNNPLLSLISPHRLNFNDYDEIDISPISDQSDSSVAVPGERVVAPILCVTDIDEDDANTTTYSDESLKPLNNWNHLTSNRYSNKQSTGERYYRSKNVGFLCSTTTIAPSTETNAHVHKSSGINTIAPADDTFISTDENDKASNGNALNNSVTMSGLAYKKSSDLPVDGRRKYTKNLKMYKMFASHMYHNLKMNILVRRRRHND